MLNDQNTTRYLSKLRQLKSGRLRLPGRIALSILCGVSLTFLLLIQYDLICSIIDDSTFLRQASVSTIGIVSNVSTSVIPNGVNPATVTCHEKILVLPIENEPFVIVSDGAEQSFVQVDEQCGKVGDLVWVLYNPRDPSDARVEDVVYHDLVIKIIQECVFGVFTLFFVISGLIELWKWIRKRGRKSGGKIQPSL